MKMIAISLVFFLFNGTSSPKKDITKTPTLTNETKAGNKGGWQNLFDGKTTKGWHSYGKTTVGDAWKVSNGTIYCNPSGKEVGDLVSNAEYSNFDLKLEWKISKDGNSGIIIDVHEDPAKYKETYQTGFEIQVLDNEGHPDGKILKHRAGDLYDLIKSSSEPVKPVGEWNVAEIICDHGKLQIFLNGTNTVTTTMWDDNWRKLIAGSKFKNMPNFGTFKQGHIALQDHGDTVWYRNIKIKTL